MSDEEILQRIAGDPAGGLAIAIDKYGKQLLGRLYARASDRGYGNADVEDVWQECFLALLDPTKRSKLLARDEPEILPWLTKLGYWRLNRPHRLAPLDEEAVAVSDPHSESELVRENAQEASDADRVLEEAWATLSDRDKILLTWRYGESRSEVEIAADFGLTVEAAKKALHDARARLRRRMEDLGYKA